jgi:carotenoid cleavage dioxygenase
VPNTLQSYVGAGDGLQDLLHRFITHGQEIHMSKSTTEESTLSTNAAENPYLSGNFAPMTRENTALDLETRGRVPDELEGRFLRIGPNPIGPVDPVHYHWFVRTGLVHGVRLRGGRAEWYRSRFTLSADAAAALGKTPISGPSARRTGLFGDESQRAVNTNVEVIGGRVHAIVELIQAAAATPRLADSGTAARQKASRKA